MSDIRHAIPQPAPDALIDEDMLCVTCGYDLRGLRLNQLCPECATPTARSKLGNFLHFAHPDWLGKVRLGVALMLWYLLVYFFSQIGAGVATQFGAAPLGQVLLVGAAILNLCAVFLVTTQEPRISLQEDPMTLRNFVRGCAMVEFVAVLLTTFGNQAWMTIAGEALSLSAIAKFFGVYVYLRRFALRIPNPKLARQTRIVMWGMAICYGIVAIGGGVAAVTAYASTGNVTTNVNVQNMPPGTGPALVAALCLALPGGLGVLVFTIWSIVLLFYYLGAFKRARLTAEAHHTGQQTGH